MYQVHFVVNSPDAIWVNISLAGKMIDTVPKTIKVDRFVEYRLSE
jgi:hypothetical protein